MTSIIKVDNLQNQCGANIINENAGTITIGASGDTVTLAAGASQSGFGRSGSVNWDTTPKTTGFTAVSGNGYFCDTTSAAFTVTLPATPAAGDIVAIADYANTAATNNITVGRNSVNIDGEAVDATIKVNGQVYTLVYVDATEGWKTVGQTVNQINTTEFVAATGGCITTCGDYKIHTFTGPGTFTVTNAGNPVGSATVDYLVVAGGGAGGAIAVAGGGGAGGYRESSGTASGCYSVSPLGAGVSALPVSVQGYPITVGAGGTGPGATTTSGSPGTNSVFSTITSTGGGKGSTFTNANVPPCSAALAGTGGSGGGGMGYISTPNSGAAGNTPPVNPSQGNNGGTGSSSPNYGGGGGGGATQAGFNGLPGGPSVGGAGATSSINGTPTTRAGGGSGGGDFASLPGGAGGGGSNGNYPNNPGNPGTINTGGGGGAAAGGGPGTAPSISGGDGGSGIVIIRYKFQ
jgi:hypothetical protein